MKKTLVVLLALVMVLAFAATALADNPGVGDEQIASYTDLADTKDEWASAIYKLTALGVLQGDGIGTKYRPDSNLTRAEFAVIATHLAGVYSQVDYYAEQASKFTDVPANYWGKGYINTAYANELMIGRGANKFDPNGKVSMQEVATVVLRILGYNFDSTYPIGYANKAEAIGLLDYIQYNGPTYITRAEMASISAEALDCYKVEYVGKDNLTSALGLVDADGYTYLAWKTNEKNAIADALNNQQLEDYFFGRYDGVTMLYAVFGCVDVEVVFQGLDTVCVDGYNYVTGDLLESLGWAYSDFDEGQIVARVFGYDEFDAEHYDWDDPINVPFADEYYIYDGELVDLAGQVATLTVDVENNNKVNGEIKYVGLETEVAFGQDSKKADEALIEFFTADDNDYNWFTSVGGVRAYAAVDYADYADRQYGIVSSVSSSKITLVDASEGDYDGIGDEITLKGDDVVFWNMDTKEFVDPANLVKGDVIYAAGSVGQFFEDVELYLVYSGTEGTLGNYNDSAAVISSTTYDALNTSVYSVNNLITVSDWEDASGLAKEVTFAGAYVPGYFTYVANTTTSYIYGVIDKYIYGTRGLDGYLDEVKDSTSYEITGVDVILPDGTTETYPVDKSDAIEADGIEVGALALLTLNKDGEVTEIIAYEESDYEDTTFEDYKDDNAYKALKVKGIEFAVDDDLDEVTVSGMRIWINDGDRLTVDEDTVIYVLKSDADNDDKYDIGSGYVVEDNAQFLSKYADGFYADVAFVAKASGTGSTQVDVLYLVDIDAYGFGIATYDVMSFHRTADESDSYVTIDDTDYTFASSDLFDAAEAQMDESNFFIYEANDYEITDFVVIGKDEVYDTDAMWHVASDKDSLFLNYDGSPVSDKDGELGLRIDRAKAPEYIIGVGDVTSVGTDSIVVSIKEDGDVRTGDTATLYIDGADEIFTALEDAEVSEIIYIYEIDGDDDLVTYIYTLQEEGDDDFHFHWWERFI